MPKYKNKISVKDLTKRKYRKNYGIRGDYYRDQTAIIHSRPFRRLKNKTQVFFAPKDDHVCTRIEHVMHVASVAATICKGLNLSGKFKLDEDLAYAIGLGHDIGHAPFGHTGEEILNKLFEDSKFIHEINSYRVVEYLANNGEGLNLTYAVKDGIISHNGENFEQELIPDQTIKNLDKIKDKKHVPSTYEGCIVRLSDKIAYFGRDIEDALVAKYINKRDIPKEIRDMIGDTNGKIIDFFACDIVKNSDKGKIKMSDKAFASMNILKDFNYSRIYKHEEILRYKEYCKRIIDTLIDYLLLLIEKNGMYHKRYTESNKIIDNVFGRFTKNMKKFYENERRKKKETEAQMNKNIIIDFISGMTDIFAIDCMKEISIPYPIDFYKTIK